MAVEVRAITLDDVESIVTILCAVSNNPDLADAFRHDALEQARGEIANSITSVIRCDGERVGRLRVVRIADFIEIAGLQVHPNWQSRGIGSAVIKDLQGESASTGVPLELDVAKTNPDAERLYVRLGFRRVGENGTDYRMRRQPDA